jgi:hypothetical protein
MLGAPTTNLRGQTKAVATATDKSPKLYLKRVEEVFMISGHQESICFEEAHGEKTVL